MLYFRDSADGQSSAVIQWPHVFVFVQARRGCLSVIGAKACAGARVALWEEHGRVNQRWSLNEDGSICSHLNRSLVLDLKGKSFSLISVPVEIWSVCLLLNGASCVCLRWTWIWPRPADSESALCRQRCANLGVRRAVIQTQSHFENMDRWNQGLKPGQFGLIEIKANNYFSYSPTSQ